MPDRFVALALRNGSEVRWQMSYWSASPPDFPIAIMVKKSAGL
ncbi:hypothetical protein [Thermorudis peleae]|nr:hypothetical protein [Thermorudis peleae]